MTNIQEAFDHMFRSIIGFSDENLTKTENLPDYTTNLGKLRTIVSELQVTAGKQKIETKGVTAYKLQLRNGLSALGADNARKLTAYAKLTRNKVLLAQVDYSESDFKRFTDESLKDYARNIYDCAESIVTQLTGYDITAATQTAFLAAINLYNDILTSPDLAETIRKQATETIVTLINVGNSYVADMAAAVEIVRIKEPIFYLGFKTAHKINVKGKIKLAVKVQTTDVNDEPVPKIAVTVTLNGGEVVLVKKTSAKGGIYIKSLAAGAYQFAFKKVGYVDQAVAVNVNDGEMTKVMVKMVNA